MEMRLCLPHLYLTVLVSSAAACGSKPDPYLHPVYDSKTGKLQLLEWDRDRDGRVDAWGHMDGTKLIKIDVDTNGDGKPDRWEYYDGTTNMIKVEISTKRDGRIDRIEYTDHGKVLRAEADGDQDGRMDRWETYDGARLASVAFDTEHHGFADRRIVYGADGSQRMELDPTGTGTFVPAPGTAPAPRKRGGR
jgi:hypothetical protein